MSPSSLAYMRGTVCVLKPIPNKGQSATLGLSVGGTPFENLIVDFTEMPWARGCKYLLLFVCTFSGWVKAFLISWTEKAHKVARCLLKEIIPWFRIPVSIGSDNGSVFLAEMVQLVAKG
jgi:hypothetical protein